jgi:hypothetical protein
MARRYPRELQEEVHTSALRNKSLRIILPPYFMREYGYLSKYSQQSREAANTMMPSIFCHRTHIRGGVFFYSRKE